MPPKSIIVLCIFLSFCLARGKSFYIFLFELYICKEIDHYVKHLTRYAISRVQQRSKKIEKKYFVGITLL